MPFILVRLIFFRVLLTAQYANATFKCHLKESCTQNQTVFFIIYLPLEAKIVVFSWTKLL